MQYHIKPSLSVISEKLARIRQIQMAGFDVAHVIHRHGMDNSTAHEVEAALIDAYSGLTNIMSGHGSSDFSVMHAKELTDRYCADIANFCHKALLINVNKTALESSMYETTRFAWRLNKEKAGSADVILSTVQGLIVGAFVAERWLEATAENFPGRDDQPGRYGFVGKEAPEDLKNLYINKRVPDEYRKRGRLTPLSILGKLVFILNVES